jgi:phosphoribosylaminoimidazole carboxylase (NCAIR synthetase)
MTEQEQEFAADILRGAEEIALYLYGKREERRKIYHLNRTSRLPTFKLGSMICARRSVLLKWVQSQEERHIGENSRQGQKA